VQRDRQHDADLVAGADDPGTTPEVDSVMRRRESERPSPSEAISSACLTLSKL
jgi:hypothetical protein